MYNTNLLLLCYSTTNYLHSNVTMTSKTLAVVLFVRSYVVFEESLPWIYEIQTCQCLRTVIEKKSITYKRVKLFQLLRVEEVNKDLRKPN